MKNTLLLLLTFSLFFACNKDDGITPHEEWTSDDNIFQCKVNGEDWEPEGNSASISGGSLAVYYVDFTKGFQLIASNKNDDKNLNQAISMSTFLTNGAIGTYKILSKTVFIDFNNCGDYYRDTTIQDTYTINISDTDSLNHIMEGTFKFKATNDDCGDTIRVSDGYFKVKYQ
jgi:hypothetical protein